MDQREHYLTPEGAERLRRELDELRGTGRQEIAARLRHAVQQGDLSENADYISAKEQQAFLEGRILDLETVLKKAILVEASPQSETVEIGSKVLVAEAGADPVTYHLVGVKEADPRQGRISHESPIGQALLGGRPGDRVEVVTPGGTIRLQIVKIL